MKKVIAKVSKKELDAIIQEELAKMKKVVALKEQKEKLQKEIKRLKEVYGVNEVSASGHKDKGEPYYMKGLPTQDFEKKSQGEGGHSVHLKEIDDEEECGELETMFSELGRKLDALLAGQDSLSDDHEEMMGGDVDDELGVGDEIEVDDEVEVEVDDEVEDEIELSEEDVVEADAEEISENEETVEEEDEVVEEQEGDTVANAADQDKVNNNMKKVDNKNPMADELYENTNRKSVQYKRLNPDNNPIINEELERMKRLSNLG